MAHIVRETLALNDVSMIPEARLHQLRTTATRGTFFVTQIPDVNGVEQEAFITILAVPLVVPYAQDTADAGLIYDDIWDESQKGFSCVPMLPAQIISLIQDTQPILLPTGQHLVQSVNLEDLSYHSVFFLPEVCDLPLCLCWPTSIGFLDFKSIITAAIGKISDHFLSILQPLPPLLEAWFDMVALDPSLFTI
jgi:hypothetical protein